MSERDKFLTEAMGECWHDAAHPLYVCRCLNGCGAILNQPAWKPINHDFSTWEGFGKLWEWVVDQSWLEDFLNIMDVGEYVEGNDSFTFDIQKEFINPEKFATVIHLYLNKETP